MGTIYLVACVAQKKNGKHPAKDLYASDWFCKAMALAERKADAWFILSAMHGLVHPDTVIANYDKTLVGAKVSERRVWAAGVLDDLRRLLKPSDEVVFLAGVTYREFLIDEVLDMCSMVHIPMKGLRIGEQRSWLKKQAG